MEDFDFVKAWNDALIKKAMNETSLESIAARLPPEGQAQWSQSLLPTDGRVRSETPDRTNSWSIGNLFARLWKGSNANLVHPMTGNSYLMSAVLPFRSLHRGAS
jgi:hypothetical protein